MTTLTIQQARRMVFEAKREELLATDAVAAAVSAALGRRTTQAQVRRWIRNGNLRGSRLGARKLVVSCAEVYRFLYGERTLTD